MRISDWSSDVCSSDLRYGDFVLYRPPFKPLTWLLWTGPFAVLLIALLIAVRFARSRRKGITPILDNAALARLIDGEQSKNDDSAKRSEAHTSELQSLMRN